MGQEHGSYVSISFSQIHTRTLQAEATAHCRGLRQGILSPLQSKLLHSFCVTFLALVVKSDPFPVCVRRKKKARERETQRRRHRETHTEEREGPRGVTRESLRPTVRESRGVAGGESQYSEDQISGAGASTSGHLSLLRVGPDNKLHFHGGAAAAVRGTLRSMKTLHSAPDESKRFWSSCGSCGCGKGPCLPEALSSCAWRESLLAQDAWSPLAWSGALRNFLRRGGHMDREGLQVANRRGQLSLG